MPSILHSSLPDAGSITHGNLDAFYNSKDQASGLAGLDSNALLKVNKIPYLGNKISIYVDSKYTGVYSDGSMLKPYVTITEALNSIGADAARGIYGEPTIDTDTHIKDQYCIFVQHGSYNEDTSI